jgi:hypothetical protein
MKSVSVLLIAIVALTANVAADQPKSSSATA